MRKLITLIEQLSMANGTSGDERRVADLIINKIKMSGAEITRDNMGNVLVFKKGKAKPKNKLMFAAHMDEVGFIVTHITDDGFIKFAAVGGIESTAILGKVIQFANGTTGVVGIKAIHQQSADEADKLPKIDDLYVDIGAVDKVSAERKVALGDNFYFKSEIFSFGDGFIKGKALDDRVGCAIMIELINSDLAFDTHFAFTVQEEVGLRGAKAAAYAIKPDFAIVLETTTACDIPLASEEKQVCKLKEGVVISFMDGRTIYDKELYKLAFDTAKGIGVKCQTKSMIAGGNDSGAIHLSGNGVRTLALSLPTRYLHSPACVIHESDLEATFKLAKVVALKIANL